MKKSEIIKLSIVWLLCMASCDKLHEERLIGLGQRVEALEQTALYYNNQLTILRTVVQTIEEHGVITSIKEHNDGTYTLTMSNGEAVSLRNGTNGKDGTDGKTEGLNISVRQDTDGIWYWTMNGEWLQTPTGERMRVTPYDGKDGKDGKDGVDGKDGKDGKDGVDGKDGKDDINLTLPVPQTRINAVTGNWEISTDNGVSWSDTGVRANGRDGTNDIFQSFEQSADGTKVTITLTDGRSFTLPVTNHP